jgi:hypothetical protein
MFTLNKTVLYAALIAAVAALPLQAQTEEAYADTTQEFQSLHLSGPRLGVSYAINSNAAQLKRLSNAHMGRYLSQFGWHFEYVVSPRVKGPSFVVEAIPFIGGVEYGKIIPSATVAMGVRLPAGFEFGMGPMAYFTGDNKNPVGTSLVVAIGQNLVYNSVNIPLNLAIATSPDGARLSFVFGYAISRK